nr:retrovirus-related Pol polyprotein from transposon 17.6 [Tanacetum cinerariifolium]
PPLAKPRMYMLREPIKVVILTNPKMNTASSSGSRTLPSNTITNPKEDLKGITTQSGTAYQGPMIPTTFSSLPQVVERETEVTKDTVPPTNNESTKDVQPLVVQVETHVQILSSLLLLSLSPLLLLTSLNEYCSAVVLKKLPEKLGDPGKFLIPCDFPRMDECLALADLGASINLMPLSVWNKLLLPELNPTLMTLELADRSISRPIGIAKDVFVKVGTFHFSADFVVVDFDADARVPLILRRSFLKTEKALINVYKGELTLRVGKEAITFNLDQTLRYLANYNDMTANRIDVIDMSCEEYSQEVLGFSNVIASANPTSYYDLIFSTSSLTLTPFRDSDFLLEEVNAFLALEDDPTLSEVDHSYYDMEGDILFLEAFLNDDPSLPPPNQGMYLPQDLPPHLEYTFLEVDDKLPVIIAKDISAEERAALKKVLKSHKQAFAWKLSDIKENELILTQLVTGWRVCIDYRMLNEATRKYHFPLPFMDQMLERLAGNEYYCFLDGFLGYFQIPIDLNDQEKTAFTSPYGMDSDFLLEEVNAFLALEDDPTLSEVDHSYYDMEGDILFLEAFLNDDPSLPPPNQGMYLPQDLPPHLEYTFLEVDDKLPVIIAKDISAEERAALKKVLKSHKQAFAWKLSDIKENELILTQLVTGWRVCIDYRMLNEATRKYHFPLPFMDQMLERLAGNEYYCFLDGFLGYFQIPIDLNDQEKTAFTSPYGMFAYHRMPMQCIGHVPKVTCLSHLEKMLQQCEDTNLCLNWEKSHFMVKEGIILGHKISKNGIEVDKAKVNVIAKLPHPTTVNGIRSFLGHVGFYRRFIQDFLKIARPMTRLLEKDTPFFFSDECIEAF